VRSRRLRGGRAASTVNLAVACADLVRVRRAYSACSRIIKVADAMLVELLDMQTERPNGALAKSVEA
jgi:flagellar basal body rod protein FlgG